MACVYPLGFVANASKKGPEAHSLGARPESLPSSTRLSPRALQLVAPAKFNIALGVGAEFRDHGFGTLAVAQLLVTIACAPRVRNAAPDRAGAPGVLGNICLTVNLPIA